MTTALLTDFLNTQHFDVRLTQNGRWIDQKCTPDTVSFVADCVIQYLNENPEKTVFESPDIWRSSYAISNVMAFFGKPDPTIEPSHDEFNKFYRQPLKMLAAAGILKENGRVNNTIQFSVANYDALKWIATRDRNAYEFITIYVEKTLKESGLWDAFATFFELQTKEAYADLKTIFEDFCLLNTPINNRVEARRIFTKVLNPLACKYGKLGTEGGHLSNCSIMYSDLLYNKPNWRDTGKAKNVARREVHTITPREAAVIDYNVNRAKRELKEFNDTYRGGRSEIVDILGRGAAATHMHHIFPKSQFPSIAALLENLIALTPGQHLQSAHPDGNTNVINRDYQYMCLVVKTGHIKDNLTSAGSEPKIYSFENLLLVLDTGLSTTAFSSIPVNDYQSVLINIDSMYGHASV